MNKLATALALATSVFIGTSQANALQVSADSRTDLNLTLYNQDLGLIQEKRKLPELKPGQNVTINSVSERMQTETLRIAGAGQISEQNLNTKLISPELMLREYLGDTITLARLNPADGTETSRLVTLLSYDGRNALVRADGQIETIPLGTHYRFIYPSVPEHLQIQPSLEFRSSGTRNPGTATISYLTNGLSWNSDYVITLNKNDRTLELEALASLVNQTGIDYNDASIRLLAGKVNTPTPAPRPVMKMAMMEMDAGQAAGHPAPQSLQDYYIYPLPGKVTLRDQQQKQVPLLSQKQLPFERQYQYNFPVYAGADSRVNKQHPQIKLEFRNPASSSLPLPAGTARVFAPDQGGLLQFIGGAQLSNTPAGGVVKLPIGEAFDLVVERRQTIFQKSFDGHLIGYELILRNSAKKPKTIDLKAEFHQPWTINNSAPKPTTTEGSAAVWKITVPAKGKAALRFQVKLTKK